MNFYFVIGSLFFWEYFRDADYINISIHKGCSKQIDIIEILGIIYVQMVNQY